MDGKCLIHKQNMDASHSSFLQLSQEFTSALGYLTGMEIGEGIGGMLTMEMKIIF